MSNVSAAQAENSQSPVTPALVQKNGEVVAFPKTDYRTYPIAPEALDFYYAPINTLTDERTGHEQKECRRHWLPLEAAQEIALALERQLGTEDFNKLVGLDGELKTCFGTGRKFQPVWWVTITEKFLDETKRLKAIPENGIVNGCFFVHPDRRLNLSVAISGTPFYWSKDGYRVAHWTPLFKAMRANDGCWGMPYNHCLAIIAERNERRQAEEGLTNKLGDFFGNGGRRDRRQFKR